MTAVLVVDDEKNIRLTLEQCLSQAGYEVEVAVSGEHALQKIQERGYDLVLLDIKLPDLDGLEVLRRLKRHRPDQTVVMITAYGSVETAVEALKVGAVDYLQKPFTPEEIRNTVSSILGRQSLAAEKVAEEFADLIGRAKTALSQHDPDTALAYLRRAVSIDPRSAEAHDLLGLAAEIRGDRAEALRMYRTALALEPSYRPSLANLERATKIQYEPPALDFPTEEPGQGE